MPVPTIREAVQAAAQALSDTARNGGTLRASIAEQDGRHDVFTTFAPYSLAATLPSVSVEGLTYAHGTITETATPAKKVAEKGAKPEAAALSLNNTPLNKYAGKATLSLEQLLQTAELERLIGGVLLRQAIHALDADIVAALGAAGAVTTTSTGSAAVLAAIGDLIGKGAQPTHIAVNPADWVSIVGATTANAGYLNMADVEAGPRGALFGLRLVPAAAVTAKTAFVYDANALVVAENVNSPLLFMGPMSDTNESLLTVDVLAVPVLAAPAGASKVAVAA